MSQKIKANRHPTYLEKRNTESNKYLGMQCGEITDRSKDIIDKIIDRDSKQLLGLSKWKLFRSLEDLMDAREAFEAIENLDGQRMPNLFDSTDDGLQDYQIIVNWLENINSKIVSLEEGGLYSEKHIIGVKGDLMAELKNDFEKLYENNPQADMRVSTLDESGVSKNVFNGLLDITNKSIKTIKNFVDEELPKFTAASATIAGAIAALPYLNELASDAPAFMATMAIGGSLAYLSTSLVKSWEVVKEADLMEEAKLLFNENEDLLVKNNISGPQEGDSIVILSKKIERYQDNVNEYLCSKFSVSVNP